MTARRGAKRTLMLRSLVLFSPLLCPSAGVCFRFAPQEIHQSITTRGLNNWGAAWVDSHTGKHLAFQDKAVDAINSWHSHIDIHLQVPCQHFDNEAFECGDKLVATLREQAVQLALQGKLDLAWFAFARGLHAVQDFYAHSNWVETRGFILNSEIGTGNMKNPTLTDRVCGGDGHTFVVFGPSSPLTSGYFEHRAYNCGDGLVHRPTFDSLGLCTSDVESCESVNQQACSDKCNACQCQAGHPGTYCYSASVCDLIPPPGKCLHGTLRVLSPLEGACQGINKDTADTPDGMTARLLAEDATTAYWLTVRDQLLGKNGGEHALCLFYGLTAEQCCVATSGCFCDQGDGTIHDTCTGLQWEKKTTAAGSGPNAADLHDVDNTYTWFEAFGWVSQVNAANFAGHSDWRLPTVAGCCGVTPPTGEPAELGSVSSPVSPIFGPTAPGYYWSASSLPPPWSDTYAFMAYFGGGVGWAGKASQHFSVRAVR